MTIAMDFSVGKVKRLFKSYQGTKEVREVSEKKMKGSKNRTKTSG